MFLNITVQHFAMLGSDKRSKKKREKGEIISPLGIAHINEEVNFTRKNDNVSCDISQLHMCSGV